MLVIAVSEVSKLNIIALTLMVDHLKVVVCKMHLWIVQLNACESSNLVFNEKREFLAIHISS